MNYSPNLVIAAVLAAVFAMSPAIAERADRDKPMNAEADALRYDDLNQTTVFTGNVVITKGTIIIRGDRVEVKQDPEGYQFATSTAAPGKLAYYRRKRDNVDEFIEGEADRMEYDSRVDNVKLIGRAVLRRYDGAKLTDETSGSVINYNNVTDVFTVDGGNRTAANPSGRVRAVLAPKPSSPAGAPAPTGPAPALKPSTSLGSDKK